MDGALKAVAVLGFSGLIRGACSCTRMLWLAEAMLSLKSTVCFCPRAAETVLFCCVSKRSASAFTEYRPGLSCGKLNRPESPVFTDRLRPFSMSVTVTVAPGMAAPAGSVTEPTIALVVSPWARAGVRSAKVKARRTSGPTAFNLGMPKL